MAIANLQPRVIWSPKLKHGNDEDALLRLNHIMMNGKDSDSLKAIQEMFKLKGRYPKLGGGIDKEIVELYEN